MRVIVAGYDPGGRVCIQSDSDATSFPHTALTSPLDGSTLTYQLLASLPTVSNSAGEQRDAAEGKVLTREDNGAHWYLVHQPPDATWPMHDTQTIDITVMLAGSQTMVLEIGEFELAAGDVYIVRGVRHGWKTGPEGCTYLTVNIGTPLPAGEDINWIPDE